MNPLIPLQPDSKRPAISGWAEPGYEGTAATLGDCARVGMRCDDLVVVDCDSDDAAKEWIRLHPNSAGTRTVQTPRGWHFYYEAGPGSPTGPMVAVFPGVDIRAGRGSYVVIPPTDGYTTVTDSGRGPLPFVSSWLPEKAATAAPGEGFDQIPEGRRNVTLTAVAGAMRKQGFGPTAIEATLLGMNRALCDPPMNSEDINTIARSICRYEPDPDYDLVIEGDEQVHINRYVRADALTLPPPPEWYWKPFFPQGRLLMLDGQEGIGKGMLCVHLAVATVHGLPLAPGAPTMAPAPVLWFTAEDDPQEDILRRLMAAGYVPGGEHDIVFWNPRTKCPRAPQSMPEFESVVRTLKPRFIVLDPGRSFIAPPDDFQGQGFNDEASVRPALESLNRLAHDTGCTIIFVHHWNKLREGSTRDKSSGSIAFQQVVRHKITVAQVGSLRALAVEKSNIIDKQNTVWSYDVEEVPEWESAAFTLGDHMPQYEGLDEWVQVAKKLDAESHVTILTDWKDAAFTFGCMLTEGDVAPTREQIADRLCVSQDESKAIRATLRDLNIITGALRSAGRWGVVPPEIQTAINVYQRGTNVH